MNLTIFNNFFLEAFENKSQVHDIFTDFAIAFDRVDHNFPSEIFYDSIFGDPLLSWFKSYLSERFKFIKIYGCNSDLLLITSGVPKKGHLSPFLFVLFINGIKKSFQIVISSSSLVILRFFAKLNLYFTL